MDVLFRGFFLCLFRVKFLVIVPRHFYTNLLRYGTEIFRRFYISILHATIEGSVREGDFALTEEQIAEILANPDEGYSVKLTVETSYKGVSMEYRFYPYSERRAMITINGSDGEFYVLRSFTDKIAADALRVIKGEAVNSTSKY